MGGGWRMKKAVARVSGTSLFTKYMLLKEEKYIQEEEKSVYPKKRSKLHNAINNHGHL